MEDAFFAGDWPAQLGRRFAFATSAGPRAGKGPGKGKGRGRHRRIDDLERFAALREMRGGGGPPFGGPFGPPRGRGRARRRRGDVRMALLILLAEEPRNGYQLMQVIEERSDGRWRPSPGSVYPVLSQLEDEGLVRATERDGAKLFELTDAGREHVKDANVTSPPWEAQDDPAADVFHELRRLVVDIARAAMQVSHVGSEQQVKQAIETLKGVRRSLYRILSEDEEV